MYLSPNVHTSTRSIDIYTLNNTYIYNYLKYNAYKIPGRNFQDVTYITLEGGLNSVLHKLIILFEIEKDSVWKELLVLLSSNKNGRPVIKNQYFEKLFDI